MTIPLVSPEEVSKKNIVQMLKQEKIIEYNDDKVWMNGNNLKEKIENFIDWAVKRELYEFLDILWIFYYSIPSYSGYHKNKNKEPFKKWLGKLFTRNLQKKYNLKITEIKERMKTFDDFLNSIPEFLPKKNEIFYIHKELLRDVLSDKSSKILIRDIKDRIRNLSDIDDKILSFTLNYIPIRVQDSIKEAERFRQQCPTYSDKYGYLRDFHIRTEQTGRIDYFEIDPKEWTYIFNLLFDEELKEFKFSIAHKDDFFKYLPRTYDEYSFFQFGDELVKIGIGRWTINMSSKGNVTLGLLFQNFVYEDIKTYKDYTIKDFDSRIHGIIDNIEKAKSSLSWNIADHEDIDSGDVKILEIDIEKSIIFNPEILEDGLELIGNQYPTSVGYIDILCRDKNGNYVVIELKRDIGTDKVVGQIQRYMVWINENLAKDKEEVRGIIVVRESDLGLEYAVKGSRFPIEIKIFGREAPTQDNIKYCTNCRKPNSKSAKYCSKCGKELWM